MAQMIDHNKIFTHGALQNVDLSTLHYALCHDWEGHVSPQEPYPPFIANDECGKFVHKGVQVDELLPLGSVAAVVYRGRNCIPGGKMIDWLVAWSNHQLHTSDPNCPLGNNRVYTEIAEAGTHWNWDSIKKKLDEGQSSAKCAWNGYLATLTISQGTSANLEGTVAFLPR